MFNVIKLGYVMQKELLEDIEDLKFRLSEMDSLGWSLKSGENFAEHLLEQDYENLISILIRSII